MSSNDQDCAICFEEIMPDLAVSPNLCNHRFHYDCIISAAYSGCGITCPLCRCNYKYLVNRNSEENLVTIVLKHCLRGFTIWHIFFDKNEACLGFSCLSGAPVEKYPIVVKVHIPDTKFSEYLHDGDSVYKWNTKPLISFEKNILFNLRVGCDLRYITGVENKLIIFPNMVACLSLIYVKDGMNLKTHSLIQGIEYAELSMLKKFNTK